MMHRRTWLGHSGAWVASWAGIAGAAALVSKTAMALPPRTLVFPRDRGVHPELRTEWWYITGNAATLGTNSQRREFGFQLTFFRTRVDAAQGMQSRFAAKQLLFAHAAITDLQGKKLVHDQRIARSGFGIAEASETDMDVRLRDWSLKAEGNRYTARLPANGFDIALEFVETQPVLLQGQQGLSRKGPDPAQASYYYSQPQLAVKGALTLANQRFAVTGTAWLDHEWSEAILHPEAVGWDWIGMNLEDGSALTAFRLRKAATQNSGPTDALWAGGSFRTSAGDLQIFSPESVQFKPLRFWKSPASQTVYPVAWQITTPAGIFTVESLLDSQELDSRSSTGAIYWEGLSDLRNTDGKRIGRGYLEMTGYAAPLKM